MPNIREEYDVVVVGAGHACRAGIFRAGFLHYEQRNEMFGPLYGDARGEQHRSNG